MDIAIMLNGISYTGVGRNTATDSNLPNSGEFHGLVELVHQDCDDSSLQ